MRKKRRFYAMRGIFVAMGVLCCTQQVRADDYDKMYLFNGGTTRTIALDDISKIVLDEDAMSVLLKGGTTETFTFNLLQKVTFTDGVTSVEEVKNDLETSLTITYRGGEIDIMSRLPLRAVTVYDVQGRAVYKAEPAADELRISTDGFMPGVYIVRASNGETTKTSKIVKR